MKDMILMCNGSLFAHIYKIKNQSILIEQYIIGHCYKHIIKQIPNKAR